MTNQTERVDVRNQRNKHGVKWQCDSYRTINGEHYIAWMSYPAVDRIMAYRAAGIRCRRFGEELYIHHADKDAATAIDRANPERTAVARVGEAK